MYQLLLRLLFLLSPEAAHHFTMEAISKIAKLPGMKNILRKSFVVNDPRLERKLWGLTFRNPVGMAAGFDKDAKYIEILEMLGFGYVEIGTVTPLPQPGNDKPRLFRLIQDKAVINRMGFNNQGVDVVVHRLKHLKERRIIIGGNIGKNKVTPNEKAVDDYIICFNKLFEVVDYFVVNVSSPNTPGLRALQEKDALLEILNALERINKSKPMRKPILLKIAPDLTPEQISEVVEIVKESGIEGIIGTNTTIAREPLSTDKSVVEAIGAGGLSGKPLEAKANAVIAQLIKEADGRLSIWGVGGIMDAAGAKHKLDMGCDLIQLYTGFIYGGPLLVRDINKHLLS